MLPQICFETSNTVHIWRADEWVLVDKYAEDGGAIARVHVFRCDNHQEAVQSSKTSARQHQRPPVKAIVTISMTNENMLSAMK